MVRVTIVVEPNTRNFELTKALRPILGISIGEISRALENGTPVFDGDLFARPREETTSRVLKLLEVLSNAGARYKVVEAGREVEPEVIKNIVRSSAESIAEFQKLSEDGHEA